MKNFTIGIDVDGVLRDNLQIMVDLYNKEFDSKMTVSDIRDFRTEVTFPIIESTTGKTASEWFFQDHSGEIFLKAKPFFRVAEDIKRLKEIANVVIITYQKTFLNRMQTLCWLEMNGIDYDGIIFMKDKTKFICDYLVDDNDWNFLGSNAKHGILIDAPYNEDKSIEEILSSSNCESLVRYKNLHEFTNDFCKLYSVE
jgi:5'(3')-deoxyribonucleotidase